MRNEKLKSLICLGIYRVIPFHIGGQQPVRFLPKAILALYFKGMMEELLFGVHLNAYFLE